MARPSLFKKSPLDLWLVGLTVAQTATFFAMAALWPTGTLGWIAGGFALTCLLQTYNTIVVSHMLVHGPWFTRPLPNALVAILNSFNMGRSAEAYRLDHVGNHHRFSNDLRVDGVTRDLSSSFRAGRDGVRGGHEHVLPYSVRWGAVILGDAVVAMLAVHRGWRVGPREALLLELASRRSLRRIQIQRVAQLAGLVALAAVSWRYALFIYLPSWFTSYVLANMQNYYEHYGADPTSRLANSSSHYGRLYNLLTFNDGYHQEHHLRPQEHWSQLPGLTARFDLGRVRRVVSRFPNCLGFLDRRAPILDHGDPHAPLARE